MARAHLRPLPGAIRLETPEEPRGAAQRGLAELAREHHLILNAAGEGIYGLDLEGRATFVNPAAAAMTGHTPSELLGRSMHDLVHHSRCDGTEYERQDCPIYAAFHDGLVRKVDTEVFFRKDGSCFPVEYTSTPIVERGRLIGAVVVFRDISVQKYTEQRLRRALDEVQALERRVAAERSLARRSPSVEPSPPHLGGPSRAMARVLELVRRAAENTALVLVEGESGTGKELVCRAIHDLGARRLGPYVAVNAAALAPTLLESELFGHERGAFTGAAAQRAGCFELAEDGTLFLDEIGELPLDGQAKLLRVLEQREFQRVGGHKTLSTNARVIVATNQDLRALVRAGRFRADLFYRLHVFSIRVPPLRERREDVLPLAEHFLARCETEWGKGARRLSDASRKRLRSHDFPGNVRELAHAIERAYLVDDGPLLELELGEGDEVFAPPGVRPPDASARLEDVERDHVLRVLESTGFRISGAGGAAELLDLHPNTLRYRMRKLGIARPG
jgi:PAS domain S-box-containing protein